MSANGDRKLGSWDFVPCQTCYFDWSNLVTPCRRPVSRLPPQRKARLNWPTKIERKQMSGNYKVDVKHKLKSTPKDLTQLEAAAKKNTDKVK